MTIVKAIREAAARHAARPAIFFRDRLVTYAELVRQAEVTASAIAGMSVRPGDRVLLLVPGRPEFVTAYLAIQMVGATVVPASVLLKPDEIAYLLRDSSARLVVTAGALYPAVRAGRAALAAAVRALLLDPLPVEADPGDLDLASAGGDRRGSLASPPDPEAVAACLYTSGTTGQPKGALLSHRNILANIEGFRQLLPCDGSDVFCCALPLSHAFAMTVLMVYPLTIGAAIVIEPRFVPDQVLKVVAERRVTLFAGVPAMFAVLGGLPVPALDFSAWRLAVSGGAPLPPDVLYRFEERYPVKIFEGYGPTECAPVLTVNPPLGRRKVGSVGVPIPGVEVRIVDGGGRELPVGEVGEIIARGPNVMKGYLGRPEETAEVLRDGWYYTGDLGRKDEEGYLYIVDRKKDLIIVGGLNVYPREVEDVLTAHPDVAEAVVLGVPEEVRGEVPKALVVLKEGRRLAAQEILQHCRRHLANYKVPRIVEFVPGLPKTPTGKVQKALLRSGAAG